jgi:hypothetical protein
MQKKNIKIKVCDLKPAKDAIGVRHHGHQFTALLNQKEGPGAQAPGGGYGIHTVQ